MTATRHAYSAPSAPPVDIRRPSRWLAALVIPVGPAAVAVLRWRLPYTTVDDPREVVAAVTAHPEAHSLVLWLGLIAILTLVPGVLWVGRLTRRHAPRLTAGALLLLVPGYLSLSWITAGDLLLWAGVHQALDADALTTLYSATHPTSAVAEGLFILGHVIGTIILGVALWRSRRIPRWAALLTIVSQPLHVVAAVVLASPQLDLVAWGMNAIGFAAAAVAILRTADHEWDLPWHDSFSPPVATTAPLGC